MSGCHPNHLVGYESAPDDDTPPSLPDFLLARIAEDEAAVRQWVGNWYDAASNPTAPSRILSECEAKRRIVGIWSLQMSEPEDGVPAGPIGGQGAEVYYEVLQHLALPYADHPDYREEWKP